MRLNSLSLTIVISLSACSLAPIKNVEHDIATIPIPEHWMLSVAQPTEKQAQNWWHNFHSAELNALITQAMHHNADLQAAAYAWQKARLAIDSAALQQNITGNATLSANSSHHYGTNQQSSAISLGLSASYQVDLWQKLSANTQSAIWTANASAEDLLATQLSLQAEVANAWLALLYAQAKLALNQQQIQHQQQSNRITEALIQEGAASELERSNAKQALNTLHINTRNIEAEIQQAQIALSILLGEAPKSIALQETLDTISIPTIPHTLPALLLHQRPDLRAAQYRLQAELGNIAIAERDFYPNINLSAHLSSNSQNLHQLLQNPIATFTSNLILPFLQHNEKALALKHSETQYQANLAKFKQTLYRAFADVEKALSAIHASDDNAKHITTQLKEAENIERLTQIRYQEGAESLQTLLNAQQSQRSIQAAQLDYRYQQLRSRIALYLALGGNQHIALIQ